MIGTSTVARHCGRDPQRFVNPAEVVVGEVQAVRGPQILPLLAERVRQPSESPHSHANREVLTLDIAGAYVARVGPSIAYFYYRLYDRAGE